MRGEARLRGLYRIISSKTIRPRLCAAKPACADSTGLFLQRPYALGYTRRSPPAQAIPDLILKDHKPSAIRGKARAGGLYRIISSKTIRPRLCAAKPACADSTGLFLQRPYALGYTRRSPPAQAIPDLILKDHKPSAIRGKARLRGLYRIISSKTIRPRLCAAKPACAGYSRLNS
jgi:hypothetical protein